MQAVVFDMDGVLFDTEVVCRRSWCEIAREFNLEHMEETFYQCVGRNQADSAVILRAAYGDSFDVPEFRRRASIRFWEIIDGEGLPVKPGVHELLQYFKEEGYRIGLASSSSRHAIDKCITLAGIESYFQVIISGDMVAHSKPNPEIYLLACGGLSVEPSQSYAIEDSYHGISAAYAAGMKPIMVPDLLPKTEEMEEKAAWICETLLDVISYLKNQKA